MGRTGSDAEEPSTASAVPRRDVFVVFSKNRHAEATLAFALKDELEQLGLYAVEYEDWQWTSEREGGRDVDRGTLRQMLADCSVVVFISPQSGDVSAGVQTELEELRVCGSPVILLHWSPDGWHPLLDHPGLEGLNIIWDLEISAARAGDVAQNQAEWTARQLANGAWLAHVLRRIRTNHPTVASLLLDRLPSEAARPLLYYRLRKDAPAPEWDEPGDLTTLATLAADAAEDSDLEPFVHWWRSGTDVLAETLAREARYSLASPIRTLHFACEALASECCRRSPRLADLPGTVLADRGLMLNRLNRHDEAIAALERAVPLIADADRWRVHESLSIAYAHSDRAAAMRHITMAIELSPAVEARCVLAYHRGKLRADAVESSAEAAGAAIADFSYVVENTAYPATRNAALRARAKIRTHLRDYDGAIADYTHILEYARTTPRIAVAAWMQRGALYRFTGRCDEAIADWTRAIQAPDAELEQRFRTLEARGQLLEAMGRPLEAADDYEAMTKYTAIARRYRDELQAAVARLRGSAV